ncbi:hypothetical protein EDD22DRAFT_961659 [Suillus occidentalis]|nr:hypothetical protein EDD22DRAFT_961659 [Suillus occidentalis]
MAMGMGIWWDGKLRPLPNPQVPIPMTHVGFQNPCHCLLTPTLEEEGDGFPDAAILSTNHPFDGMVKDEAGMETLMDWSYLRNRFMDFYIDFTSELWKVARGSMNVTDGFITHSSQRDWKISDLIRLFKSGDLSKAFQEVLWASIFQPITKLAEGTVRIADLYPDAIQSWTGYLQKGIVGVITTLIYQGLTHPAQDKSHLKAPVLFPIVMTALDDMYKHPADFSIFFKEAHELLFLQEANVLVLELKHGIPKVMSDGQRKTLEDVKPIELKAIIDYEVPNAEFAFPATSMAQIHISYFTPTISP